MNSYSPRNFNKHSLELVNPLKINLKSPIIYSLLANINSKVKSRNANLYSLKKKGKLTELGKINSNRLKIKKDLKIVNILSMDDEIDNILSSDLELQRQKDKIDKNNNIKLIRLGLYKKKENEENKFKLSGKETNEDNLEKIETENRHREKSMERKYKEKLNNFENLKSECISLNKQINEISKIIDDSTLEVEVIEKYSDEFDQKCQQVINEVNKKDEVENNNNENFDRKRRNSQHFTQLNKVLILRQKRDEKHELIKENIKINKSLKIKLENELLKKKEQYYKMKIDFNRAKKDLINIYHIKLYEGTTFHGEGLPSIIKDIWNLGVNVDINFMPTYLDSGAIAFLFQKANQSIEINKIRH